MIEICHRQCRSTNRQKYKDSKLCEFGGPRNLWTTGALGRFMERLRLLVWRNCNRLGVGGQDQGNLPYLGEMTGAGRKA